MVELENLIKLLLTFICHTIQVEVWDIAWALNIAVIWVQKVVANQNFICRNSVDLLRLIICQLCALDSDQTRDFLNRLKRSLWLNCRTDRVVKRLDLCSIYQFEIRSLWFDRLFLIHLLRYLCICYGILALHNYRIDSILLLESGPSTGFLNLPNALTIYVAVRLQIADYWRLDIWVTILLLLLFQMLEFVKKKLLYNFSGSIHINKVFI